MVRTVKPIVSKSAPASVILNVAVKNDKVVKVEKVKKEKAPKADVIVPSADVVVDAAITPVVESVEVDTSIAGKLNEFNGKLQQLVAMLGLVKTDFKGLEKTVNREMKAQYKASSKKNKRSGNREPSGFTRPTLISDELATFLSKVPGTEMARTAVSKEINQYIRTNNLQDKDNGRQINADDKLIALLKLQPEDVLTYFNLQRFMKHHFMKAVVPVVDTAVPV